MSQIIDPEAPQPAASLDNREANQADNDGKGTEQTPTEVKKLTQTLLRQGFIEEAKHATEFRRAATRQTEINAALEALDLSLHLSTNSEGSPSSSLPRADSTRRTKHENGPTPWFDVNA